MPETALYKCSHENDDIFNLKLINEEVARECIFTWQGESFSQNIIGHHNPKMTALATHAFSAPAVL